MRMRWVVVATFKRRKDRSLDNVSLLAVLLSWKESRKKLILLSSFSSSSFIIIDLFSPQYQLRRLLLR
jgi:hypothetical protein